MSGLEDDYAVGLDLGTTYSCIGVYRNGGVEIIPNRNGEKTTPSIVTILNENKILKGEETLSYLVKDYDSSIYAIKRFIGRKYNDQNVKNEILKENFPFKIIGDKDEKYPLVLIDKNNQKIKFTLEEISSFVIRKMVDNAEKYLGQKVNRLVITVPANFNDAQRNCTKQAAKLAGVEVLRIINEPTAAALAYGLESTNSKDSSDKEKKILVFDLGGGTFDVTILKIDKTGENNFDILSTQGDKFLGGEDFDNKLVEYVLKRFCQKMKISEEEIKKDKKCIKKLKISCEKIKRVLSIDNETTLLIKDFYKNNDILEIINRSDFERMSSDIFDRLKIPLDDALADAKLTKEEISEIVLVGGSSRIPKVKTFLKEYFNLVNKKGQIIKDQKTKINDSINPDETIAYGATLMAAKILIKNDLNLVGFNLMDITPLSLGIGVKNNSTNPEIQKEGLLMSVIIKKGSSIPLTNLEKYETSSDYQTCVHIKIFEGEKKYTKYNHLLGELLLNNIPKKKKGEVKIDVKFYIDVNGILTATATEQSTGNSIETKIINDNVGLTDEDIEKIKEKNKKYIKSINETEKTDYSNLKQTLKEFQDAYNEAEEEDDKYNILLNYNCVLEEFINLFDKDFDNETLVEKYYIYIKQLIQSYTKLMNMKENITKGDIENILKNIKEYIKIFIKQNSGYLDDLVETMKEIDKKYFYEIIVIIMEQLNECGKKCLADRKAFCKYHSLIYFEKADLFFTKYIIDLKKLLTVGKAIKDRCQNQLAVSRSYINDINSGAILLFENSLKTNKLIESKNTGFTNTLMGLKLSPQEENEKYQIIMSNYEKMLINLSDKISKEKAMCIANIMKIGIRFLGDVNLKKYMQLGEDCEFIVRQLNLDKNEEWYIEFKNIYNEVKDNYKSLKEDEKDMKEKIKSKYKNEFDEIDNKFSKKKNKIDFIKFILQLRPYKGYEEDKKNNKINLNGNIQDLLEYLKSKYHPDNYTYSDEDEQSQLDYCIVEYIESYINKMNNNI